MSRKFKRRGSRLKTIVIKKPMLWILLFVFCLGVGLSMIFNFLAPYLSGLPHYPAITQFYKLSMCTVMPCIQTDEDLEKNFYKDISVLILGFDPVSPTTILAGQLPIIAAAEEKILQTAQNTQKDNSLAQGQPSAPPQNNISPSPETDATAYPIVEVSKVVGGIRNIGGPNKEIYVNNHTSFEIDIQSLLEEPLKIKPEQDKPFVLIVHTHTTESYTPDGQNHYSPGESTRTLDATKNVVRVGGILAEQLKQAGINVIHDTTVNDYPSYSGSYKKTLGIIESYLEKYPSIQVVIDVHRDGMTKEDGTKLKTCAEINGEKAAQVMLVIGSSEGGLAHENWRENLKLGIRIQDRISKDYPRLARPLDLVKERYNQHATLGSMILEVGTDGNTLAEACTAAKYAGKAIAEVLKSIS